MVMSDTLELFPVELAHRAGDGVEIRLFWHRPTNSVFVTVFDSRTGESFHLDVPGDRALEAFYHPYAFAANRGPALDTAQLETVSV
jgi:hypothetical protein